MNITTIGIVSISSILAQHVLEKGTNDLAHAGYRVKVAPNVAGPDVAPAQERARTLEDFWLDPEIDLLWFSRGGEGAAEVVPLLDWDKLRARPDMPVVGFSDVTMLLNAMLAKGVGHPCSGPMVSAERYWNEDSRRWFAAALRGEELPPLRASPLKTGERAPARGLPMGGHLERMHRLWKAGLAPDAAGRVVFLECTAKYPPSKVRECLEELRDGGALEGAAAVVFCDFRHAGAARTEIFAFLETFASTLP